MLRRLGNRIGRRGTALLFFALLDLVYAFGLMFPSEAARNTPTLRYVADIAPLWTWALLWALAGLACLVQAPMRRDRWAFSIAIMVKALWGLMFVGAIVVGLDRAYLAAAIWLAMAGWVFVISTWPEPPYIGAS